MSLVRLHRGSDQDCVVHDVLKPSAGRLKKITVSTKGFSPRDSLLTVVEWTPSPILEQLNFPDPPSRQPVYSTPPWRICGFYDTG